MRELGLYTGELQHFENLALLADRATSSRGNRFPLTATLMPGDEATGHGYGQSWTAACVMTLSKCAPSFNWSLA